MKFHVDNCYSVGAYKHTVFSGTESPVCEFHLGKFFCVEHQTRTIGRKALCMPTVLRPALAVSDLLEARTEAHRQIPDLQTHRPTAELPAYVKEHEIA